MTIKITDKNESLEWNAGYEYAETMFPNGEPVDIERILTSSCDIPGGDYDALIDGGVENPDAGDYWTGFNAYYRQY